MTNSIQTTQVPQERRAIISHSGYMGDARKEWSVDVFDFEKVCAAAKLDPAAVLADEVDTDAMGSIMFSQDVDAEDRCYALSQDQAERDAIAAAQNAGYTHFFHY